MGPVLVKSRVGRIGEMGRLSVALSEDFCGGGFVFEFGVGFVDGDVGGGSGGESAVGVEGDAVGGDVF